MRIRFWGTRGSIAKAGYDTVRYGGNTSCVEVRSASGTLFVLDCGTGAHGLGQALVTDEPGPLHGHILITHTHWDHTQGLPFFQPLLDRGNEWDIYGPCTPGVSTRDVLAGQTQYAYFPVTLGELAATIRYHDLVEGTFEIGDVRVTTQYLNHPALTLGYRLEADGVVVVYATDHEPHSRQLAMGRGALMGGDQRHASFLAGADLVIHDAQYTAAEYPEKIGWGHSTWEYVVAVASSVGIKRVALFHHDPLRDDVEMDRLVETAQKHVADASTEIIAAAEGHLLELEGPTMPAAMSPRSERSAVASLSSAMLHHSVLVAVEDPAASLQVSEALREDGFRLLVADDGQSALEIVRAERPSLILLDRHLPDGDGVEVCRKIRAEGTSYGTHVPVVLITDQEEQTDRQVQVEAGVTDWLTRPFSSVYARTRIQAWVLRTACRWNPAPIPRDEASRIRALRQLRILDTQPEERFDRLTRLAAALFHVPIALVSLVDTDRQWFKSCLGMSLRQTPRDVGFCAHAVLSDDILVIPDALEDPRFADNPLVTGDPHIRFYVGAPLSVPSGLRVGTLCLIDHRPRRLDEGGRRLVRDLAILVERELAVGRKR